TGEGIAVYELIDPLSLLSAGAAAPDDLGKIGTNNRLRRVLRTTVARFAFENPDPAVRLGSVKAMLRSLDEATSALLRKRLSVETDPAVRSEIETGLALVALDSADVPPRMEAIEMLSHRLRPEVRTRLAALLEKSADGGFTEPNPDVR